MKILCVPELEDPQCFSTPSTAAAIAFPFSAALSIRAVASCKHFAMSSKAKTSPFSTTGRCLNFPVDVHQPCIKRARHSINLKSWEHISINYQPCTIFWRASTARVSERTNTGFLVITLETGVSSGLISSATTFVAISCKPKIKIGIKAWENSRHVGELFFSFLLIG